MIRLHESFSDKTIYKFGEGQVLECGFSTAGGLSGQALLRPRHLPLYELARLPVSARHHVLMQLLCVKSPSIDKFGVGANPNLSAMN